MKKLLLFFFLLTFSLGYSQGAAPGDPGKNSWDVISLFSAAYTDLAGTNFNPNWGQTSGYPGNLTTPSYGGDEVKQYQNTGNYQGTETAADVNISAMTKFHIEIYSSTLTSIRVSLIKTTGGGVEVPTTLALTPGTWNVFNIDISGAAYNAVRPIFRQIKYDQPAGAGNIQNLIVDNMFFWRPATTQPPTFGPFTVPAKVVGDAPFGITDPTSNSLGAFTYTSSNTAVATISGSTITVVGAGTSTITATQAADGIYGAGSTTATLTVTPPAAPTPPARNSWDVISFYSDGSGYPLSSTPTWGGSGSSDVSIGGNNVRFLANVTASQIAFAATNVSEMTHVHIDVFSINQTPMWFWLMNQRVIVPTPINGWTSVDIPLSSYSTLGVNLSTVNLFKIENPTGAGLPLKQVYVDNIYFYRAATLPPPTLGALTLPSPVVLGDAPAVLTNPTTNSTGTFTYTSSNTAVATVSGNTLTFVGGGTSTITATVSSDGTYGARSTSATLTVSFPAPGPSPVPPARDPASVVSMYTGTPTTYANGTTAVQASWSTGSTNSNFAYANGSDTCIQVNNLGYFGLVTNGANFSVAGMSTLHVDIYVNTPMTTMILNLLAPSDRNYSIGPLATGWNSFDIPLTTYPGVLTNINGIKFEQSGGTPRQIYIDNVYFYTGGAPALSNFPAIAKVNGAAPFNLTAPTSTSPGTFTYTSSNPLVATISGNTVTVVGAGTSTITATQAASGFFTTGSISATLTVAASSVPLSGPTAPPARNSWDAFSVFSDEPSYTLIPGTRNYNPGWGQAGAGAVVLAGADNVWRASNLNYQGIVFGSNADVSAMTHFHVDVWTFDETSLQFFQISNTTGERSVALAAPYGALTQGSWISYDIPLTAWTSQGGFSATNLKEFKIVGTGGKTVYMDNMYFYRAATTQPPTLGAFTVPAQLVGAAPFTLTAPTSNSLGAFTYTSSNTAVATISGDTVTIVGAGTSTITATQAADGSYGSGSTTATLSVTPPAAPTPPVRNTWDRISFYSDAYANQSTPTWGGQTADVTIEGNTTRVMNNFLFGQVAFANVDVSAMTWVHVDVFSLDQTPLWFWLGNQRVILPTPINGWTSLDIPLSDYATLGVNLAAVNIFKIENPNGAGGFRNAYVDNIYFYRDATLPPATVGTFTVPAKVLGDAPFQLTPPTSNNVSPFTYTSSNTSIATISGDMVTVVGGGTAVITASQVTDGVYGPTSSTANLVVTYPVPGPSPIPPARDPLKVMSVYTGTPAQVYADSPAYSLVRTSWTGATTANFNFANGDNTCIQVNNLGFIGLADTTERRLNVTAMTNLHLDVYCNTPISNLFVFLLAPGDRNYSTGPLVAGWNSLNIPLSAYPGALNDIYGFKIEQNVAPSSTQIYLDNIYFSDDNATFYQDSDGDGYGNILVTTVATTQPVGYVSNSDDCDDTNALLNPTNPCAPPVSIVNLRFFVQGFYTGASSMNSVKFNQDGVSSPTDVADITVELHATTAPYETLHSATATVQTDGIITVSYSSAPSGSFYVVVKGSNMVQTWSSTPQTVGSTPLSYDFSIGATQAYGDNMIEVEPGVWAFFSGDLNQDNTVDNTDSDALLADVAISNFGPLATDVNGDGSVDNSDTDLFFPNLENSVFASFPE
ncbi:MAG: hypothetical protein IPP30_03275 [Flavobacterium sp.]|nr:hypothetical protein [Flavobacterium sp.]